MKEINSKQELYEYLKQLDMAVKTLNNPLHMNEIEKPASPAVFVDYLWSQDGLWTLLYQKNKARQIKRKGNTRCYSWN